LGAVWLAFRAERRARWRSWVAIAALISVVGGLVLAAGAAGGRTEGAFPSFLSVHGFDVAFYAAKPLPSVRSLPGVTSVIELAGPDNGSPACSTCTHPIDPTDFGVAYVSPEDQSAYRLVSGRLPNPDSPDEVLASTFLQGDGVHIGTIIRVPFYARSQAAAYNDATSTPPRPTGPTVSFRVVGLEATEFEFPSGGSPTYLLYASRTFERQVLPKVAGGDVYFLRLAHGQAGFSRFAAAANKLSADGVEGYEAEDQIAASIQRSIHPQAVGWWLLALLAGLVGLAVVGQALARQSALESGEYPTLGALGLGRNDLFTLGMARSAVVGVAGAVGALGIGTLLSPIAPLGEARAAETSTGIQFNTPVLLLGALGIVLVVLALAVWPAFRAARASFFDTRATGDGPPLFTRRLAATGLSAPALIGVRNAFDRRRGAAAAPVGSALLGTVLAVTALCGTAVFGASLSHLTTTPTLYGDRFQLNFSDPIGGVPNPGVLRTLQRDPAVDAVTNGFATEITVDKIAVGALIGHSLKGPLLLSTVSGRLPDGPGDIGLGQATMRAVGATVGSTVLVSATGPGGTRRTLPFRVSAQVSFPVLGGFVELGTGAVLNPASFDEVVCGAHPSNRCDETAVRESGGGGLLVNVVPGPKGTAALNRYLDRDRAIVTLASAPTSLINFGQAVNFPLIFGAMLAVFGAATLTHLLIVSVARRRQDVGLLKVIGFVRRQVAATVAWQASTLALIGIVLGVPLGLAVGQTVWRTFANDLGTVPVVVIPVAIVVALAGGALVVANAIALLPALAATRTKPSALLRSN
jgi:hypothetical protein